MTARHFSDQRVIAPAGVRCNIQTSFRGGSGSWPDTARKAPRNGFTGIHGKGFRPDSAARASRPLFFVGGPVAMPSAFPAFRLHDRGKPPYFASSPGRGSHAAASWLGCTVRWAGARREPRGASIPCGKPFVPDRHLGVRARGGDRGAQTALDLRAHPAHFCPMLIITRSGRNRPGADVS